MPIYYLVYKIKKGNSSEEIYDILDLDDIENNEKIRRFLSGTRPLPYLVKQKDDKWRDMRLDEVMSSEEVIVRYADAILQRFDNTYDSYANVPDPVKELLNAINVRFISADRLTVRSTIRKNSYSEEEIQIEDKITFLRFI